MKKLAMLVCCALLLVVSGCSDASTNVSDKNEALITVGGEEITKGDVYEGLSSRGNITPVTTAIAKQVVKKAVPVTKELEKEAKDTLESLKQSVGADKWENYLKTNGFKDEKDYYENSVLLNARVAKITEAYVTKNLVELAKEYEVRKLEIMVTPDKDKANEAIDALKAEKKPDFKAAAAKYGDTSKYNGSEGIYTNQSGIPDAVYSNLLTLKDGEMFEKAIFDDATSTYYIVRVVSSKAKTEFKADAINAIKNITTANAEGLKIDERAFNFYLNETGYAIHDAAIYAELLKNSLKYQED